MKKLEHLQPAAILRQAMDDYIYESRIRPSVFAQKMEKHGANFSTARAFIARPYAPGSKTLWILANAFNEILKEENIDPGSFSAPLARVLALVADKGQTKENLMVILFDLPRQDQRWILEKLAQRLNVQVADHLGA